jgi:hypothetical protein
MILSIVALFIIVVWDRSSYIDLLMFYGLTYLSFLRISFSWIPIVIDVFFDWLLSFSKLLKYQHRIHFRQYRIDFVFEKKNENKSDFTSYGSLPIFFIPTPLSIRLDSSGSAFGRLLSLLGCEFDVYTVRIYTHKCYLITLASRGNLSS